MIYYVDEIMGSGKTTAAIQAIKAAPPEQKFMFVTPYLSEVARVKEECGFREPEDMAGCKTISLGRLLDIQANIVMTHALFDIMPHEFLDKIRGMNYTLFLDETFDAIVPVADMELADSSLILDKLVSIDDDMGVSWVGEKKYRGVFSPLKDLCDKGRLKGIKNSNGGAYFFGIIPTDYFTSFKDVVIMTYLFSGQTLKHYLDIERLPYQRLYLQREEQMFTKIRQPRIFEDYRSLIVILNNERMNKIGEKKTALSHSWYLKNGAKTISKHLDNYFKNIMKAPAAARLWTTFAAHRETVGKKNYKKSFLACNAKATNEYKDKTVLAYLVNRYRNPFFVRLFDRYGIRTNNDMFALSEMLQWLWRSALREGKPVTLYIPSSRMRGLLTKWLDYAAGDLPEYDSVEAAICGKNKEQMFDNDFEEDDFYE